jgi:hypothetical protein
MRKLTILLGLAALAASTTGCCGRCTSWFKKGSPCGTVMTPTVLGAPMAGPVLQPSLCCEQPQCCPQAQPVMCMPCDPCVPCDPCAPGAGMSTGYFGSYLGNADCACEDGAIQTVPGTMGVPAGATIVPQPM